jgi:hypothetical protein
MRKIAEKLEFMNVRAVKVCAKTEIDREGGLKNSCFCVTVYQIPP